MAENSEVFAIDDGYIEAIGEDNLNGVFVRYKTLSGYTVIYAHLNKYEVNEGDFIFKGQKIALSGNTGYSTGPHLHIGVKNSSGEYINPETLFEEAKRYGLLIK